MGDGDSPVGLSVISFKGMRSWLDKLLLWALILSIALQNAAVDCKRVEINELPSPNLNSSINVVRMGQNVSLSCSTKNTSVDITYSLFWGTKYLESKRRRGGAVDFQLSISNVNKTGPYKCKINVYNVSNVSNSSKYSQDFNFTIARAEQPQEIHYAIPVFKESAPTEQEGSMDRKADYFYSELTY
ncbi:allergin-1 isoform X3 [Mastomys coucha]|uniref:allergin-1 isoform X3 n=1 Tax=Mastomys coucha TaxID=35658 RepID=UPI001261FCCC|nr:allergin-1 isoform X3 [Mastomys coucha]